MSTSEPNTTTTYKVLDALGFIALLLGGEQLVGTVVHVPYSDWRVGAVLMIAGPVCYSLTGGWGRLWGYFRLIGRIRITLAPTAPVISKTQSLVLPYPKVQIFRHKEARKHNDEIFQRIFSQFDKAGWRVESGNTDLPQHENGIRIAGGGAGYEVESAKWGLKALGLEWSPDERTNQPDELQIIVGRYENKSNNALTPLRALERFYLALADLRAHVDRMLWLAKESPESSRHIDFIAIEMALEKIRNELVNLSPALFPMSVALDFQKPNDDSSLLANARVPKAIDDLMKKVRQQWGVFGEKAGVTPLKFKETPIVKLTSL